MQTLTGKTAVVTGASRGSGRAAALALAKAGAQVIVHYRQSADEAHALVADIRAMGSRSDAIAADLASPDGPHRLARRVRSIVGERLDILVANAGIHAHSAAVDLTVDDFTRQFALDVRAPYFLVQQLLPIMCKGSSVVFLLPWTAHAAAKRGPVDAADAADAADSAITGAVQTMTRHFALALGERGVRVNAISLAPECHEHVVTFLASDAARWITGAITPGVHR